MKNRLIAGLSLLGAFAVVALAPSAYSKDDKDKEKEKEKEERAELVEKYETKKGGKLFASMKLYVNKEKLKETRWEFKTLKASTDNQRTELIATIPSGRADQPPRIEILVRAFEHKTHKGGNSYSVNSFSFDEANMSGVAASDAEEMMKAFYLSFMNTAKDPIEKECTEPKKKGGFGPGKYFAEAVATDAKMQARVRKQWFAWQEPNWTIVTMATFANSVYDKKDWVDKVKEFMKNVKDAK